MWHALFHSICLQYHRTWRWPPSCLSVIPSISSLLGENLSCLRLLWGAWFHRSGYASFASNFKVQDEQSLKFDTPKLHTEFSQWPPKMSLEWSQVYWRHFAQSTMPRIWNSFVHRAKVCVLCICLWGGLPSLHARGDRNGLMFKIKTQLAPPPITNKHRRLNLGVLFLVVWDFLGLEF